MRRPRCGIGVDIQGACDNVGLGEVVALELAHDAAVIHDDDAVAAADQLVIVGRVEQDCGAWSASSRISR
jgi:hypothetical protein